MYLVMAVTVKGKTGELGATTTNRLVNISDFFAQQVGIVALAHRLLQTQVWLNGAARVQHPVFYLSFCLCVPSLCSSSAGLQKSTSWTCMAVGSISNTWGTLHATACSLFGLMLRPSSVQQGFRIWYKLLERWHCPAHIQVCAVQGLWEPW